MCRRLPGDLFPSNLLGRSGDASTTVGEGGLVTGRPDLSPGRRPGPSRGRTRRRDDDRTQCPGRLPSTWETVRATLPDLSRLRRTRGTGGVGGFVLQSYFLEEKGSLGQTPETPTSGPRGVRTSLRLRMEVPLP